MDVGNQSSWTRKHGRSCSESSMPLLNICVIVDSEQSYNPHIFLRNPASPISTSNICSVVALGADDRSVSVWQTKSARPLIVAKEVFERQIMDLSW